MNNQLQADKQARITGFREQMIEKWRGDLNRIENEVIVLHQSRSIYNRLFGIVDQNPRIQKPNALYDWLQRNYAVTAAMSIRRLLDTDRNTLSLACLIKSMSENAHLITREWFVSQYTQSWGDEDFDTLVGVGRDTLDPDDLSRRLEEVRSLCIPVRHYVDKFVAHKDKKQPAKLPTFGSLDKAIDAVGGLFEHLHCLLNQSSFISLVPVESFRWERLLKEPWIVSPDRPETH